MGSSCHKDIYLEQMEPADDEPPRMLLFGEDISKLMKKTSHVHECTAQITKRTSIDILTGTLNFQKDITEQIALRPDWINQTKEGLSKPLETAKVFQIGLTKLAQHGDVEIEGEIFDYSLELHLPRPEYAISVNEDFDVKFELSNKNLLTPQTASEALQRLQSLLSLKITKNVIFSELPHLPNPYFIFSKQVLYIGQWKFGVPGGIGIMYHQNSSVDEGEFEGGLLHGRGRRVLQDGTYLEGQFFKGEMDGKGSISMKNGFSFEGDWLNGKPHGEGKEVWPDQTSYQGSFRFGLKDGSGTQVWIDQFGEKKEVYQGQFKDGYYHGKGVYTWHNGRSYEGDWLMGKMHGKGIFKWKDGRKYEGEYYNDLKHGEGIFTWPEVVEVKNELEELYLIPKKQWIGSWKNGVMHGQGDLFYKGKHHKGIWEKGKLVKQFNIQ